MTLTPGPSAVTVAEVPVPVMLTWTMRKRGGWEPLCSSTPSRQVPAMVFMQPAADGKKAVVLLSSNVRAVFGEGVCVAGGEICQLMALKPGLPETVVYGGSERTYRITLLGVHLEETDQLRKAPLGTNPKGSNRPKTMAVAPSAVQPK